MALAADRRRRRVGLLAAGTRELACAGVAARRGKNASIAAASSGRANRNPWPLSQSSSLQQRQLVLLLDALGERLDRERLAELHERVDQGLAFLLCAGPR